MPCSADISLPDIHIARDTWTNKRPLATTYQATANSLDSFASMPKLVPHFKRREREEEEESHHRWGAGSFCDVSTAART